MDLITIIIILALGMGAGLVISKKLKFFNKETKMIITSTIKEIMPIKEFACMMYRYSDVVIHEENTDKFYNKVLNFTGKKAIFTREGIIKLGFDCEDINIDYTDNFIILRMPDIKILSHEPLSSRVYDEKTGVFTRYTLKSSFLITEDHKEEKNQEVLTNKDLMIQAQKLCKDWFEETLANLPGIKDKYEIDLKWKELPAPAVIPDKQEVKQLEAGKSEQEKEKQS